MTKRIWSRPGSVIALVAGAALLALFFLPWVRLVGIGAEIGTATGSQLAAGSLDVKLGTLGKDVADARPWFWFGVAVPGLVFGAGALGVTQIAKRRPTGTALVLLALAGAGVTLLALDVKYAKLSIVQTEPTAILWTCVGLYGLIALGGLMEIAVSMAAGERSSRPRREKRRRS